MVFHFTHEGDWHSCFPKALESCVKLGSHAFRQYILVWHLDIWFFYIYDDSISICFSSVANWVMKGSSKQSFQYLLATSRVHFPSVVHYLSNMPRCGACEIVSRNEHPPWFLLTTRVSLTVLPSPQIQLASCTARRVSSKTAELHIKHYLILWKSCTLRLICYTLSRTKLI